MSLSTTNAFDCEKECKIHQDCSFFKFSEHVAFVENVFENVGVCELFESEFRHGCHNLAGPLVSKLYIELNIGGSNACGLLSYLNCLHCKLKYLDIEHCLSTPSMSCERVMLTDCSFEDDHTTYISSWPKQKSGKDCQNKCQVTTIPKCHFWMEHVSDERCDLYERDKRTCHAVAGPASLTGLYCTGMM